MNKRYIWPGLMLAASATNMVGFSVAIITGAADGTIAFKTSLTTSTAYAFAQIAGIYTIYADEKKSFADNLAKTRELKEIIIQR